MNNSYISYKNYVESTDYYKNLCNAIKLSNELVENIETLINALGRDNGELITNAINELEYFKEGAEYLAKDYAIKRDKLLENANTYDTKFYSLKSTIGNMTSSSFEKKLSDGKIANVITNTKVKYVNIDDKTGYIRVEKEVFGTINDNDGNKIVDVSPSVVVNLYNLNGRVA